MKYMLLKMPDGEIRIEDDSTIIGMKHAELACLEGTVLVGFIETGLSVAELRTGLNLRKQKELNEVHHRLWKVKTLIDKI